ncbi:FAD-dependent oxidoreductase [Arthrobacter oryzae]|uniref:FAD-dependent oxidoreductase n=1 Tax=Arthrobacter oryzae TaxID=409290 RepID=UPI00273ACF52|nr:FAD-dependent oxidoreductase [Arthrobacter oryzae]WLQ05726.1 NAD-binding protein [Arthrobacter oryzae]
MKKRVSVPVIGVGRLVWLLDELNDDVAAGELDFVAMGRAGLADPTIVEKTRRGETSNIRRCLAVKECISRWMFNGQHTQCVINPALSQEKRAAEARRLAVLTKRVLIVGAGPAGCEAAILAAERGHEVTLADRRAPEAKELTVHGDTETAMFAALWLAEQDRKVTLSSPSADIGLDTNDMQRNHLRGLLAARNVTVLTDQPDPAG